MTANIKIIIADDHPLFRAAIKRTIEDLVTVFEHKISITETQSVAEVYSVLEHNNDFDLVLLDVNFPGTNGMSGLANLRGCFPLVPVAMISGNDSSDVIELAQGLGACGFISKSAAPEAIAKSITTILSGEYWFPNLGLNPKDNIDREIAEVAEKVASLTPHQFRIFTLVCEGLLNKQIAYELGISENTVKTHMSNIFVKFNVRKRTSLIVLGNLLNAGNG